MTYIKHMLMCNFIVLTYIFQNYLYPFWFNKTYYYHIYCWKKCILVHILTSYFNKLNINYAIYLVFWIIFLVIFFVYVLVNCCFAYEKKPKMLLSEKSTIFFTTYSPFFLGTLKPKIIKSNVLKKYIHVR